MISLHLARWLRDAGLEWNPSIGDEFVMPDHDIDRTFMIAEMVVEVRHVPAGRIIALNGTPEWAMDAILFDEAVWMPREDQLRALLGDRFVGLVRDLEGMRVDLVHADGSTSSHVASTAIDATAKALLATLREPSARAVEAGGA
jgi:hypothetical protein